MNPHVLQVYDRAFTAMNTFNEPIRFDHSGTHLHEGMYFNQEYTKEEDCEQISNSIKKQMSRFGIHIIIKSNSAKTRKKSGKKVRYVRLGCAYSQHVRDGTLKANREKKVFGGKTGKARKTSSKRISQCPLNINLVWDSVSCRWKVGYVKTMRKALNRCDAISIWCRNKVFPMRIWRKEI
jgi:hypothetical protein